MGPFLDSFVAKMALRLNHPLICLKICENAQNVSFIASYRQIELLFGYLKCCFELTT